MAPPVTGSRATPAAATEPAPLATASGWLLLFVAAVVVRSLRFGLVFVNGAVRFPYEADELYHMRRIWYSVVNFPASLDFDFYVNHPLGGRPVWPPLFDWVIAAVARALVGATDQHAVEVVAAWMPPLLGALGVLAAAWLARRTFSPAAGWATGALLVGLPAHVGQSELGLVDHHVAVGLVATLLVASAMRLAGPPGPGRVRAAAGTAAMIGLAILLWPGALLHVVVLQLFLVVQVLVTAERERATARARDLAVAHGLAALLLLPFCVGRDWPDFGRLSPWVLSDFQPLWFGAGAVTLAGLGVLWAKSALGASRLLRIGSGAGLAGLGVAVAWFGIPGLPDAVRTAAGFFEPAPFLQVVAELSPLLYPDGRFDPSLAQHDFSYLFWTFPLALAWLATRAVARGRADVLLLLFASTAFVGATLRQQRFTDVGAAAFALVVAPAIVDAFGAARRRFPAPRVVWLAAALPVVAGALLPYAPEYPADLQVSRMARAGQRLRYGPDGRVRRVTRRVAEWLRHETPPTRGYLDAGERPEYGVLCPWGLGHRLRYYAERPMVQDNFNLWGGRAGFAAARRYYESRSEHQGVSIASQLGVRYVVATAVGSGQRLPPPGSLAKHLALSRRKDGTLSFSDTGEGALRQHRLVYVADDRDLAREPGAPPWTEAVYELVAGAQVSGRGVPDQPVSFELAVPLPGRRAIPYRATAWVDAAGRYEIRLPYPSEAGYRVHSGARDASIRLSEADVREGRQVVGPDFE